MRMSWPRTQTQRSLTSRWRLKTRILRRLSTQTRKSLISQSIQRTRKKSFWWLRQMMRKWLRLKSILLRRQTRETTGEGLEQDAWAESIASTERDGSEWSDFRAKRASLDNVRTEDKVRETTRWSIGVLCTKRTWTDAGAEREWICARPRGLINRVAADWQQHSLI